MRAHAEALVTAVLSVALSASVTFAEEPKAPTAPAEAPADARGASLRVTPERVAAAAKLVTTGKIYPLGRAYEAGMPLFTGRIFSLTIPGNPTGGPVGENRLVYNDEMVSAPIGQVGTQFDGLGHIGVRTEDGRDLYYGGREGSKIVKSTGIEEIGVETAGPFFTRGVLLDVARAKDVERLHPGYEITLADLAETMAKQETEIREGDVVLFRTGHGTLWMKDNETYNGDVPGIGLDVARVLVAKKIVMTGADTWPTEVIPNPNAKLAFPVHELLIAENGIFNLENLDLEALAADRVYEFAFVFSPLRLKGATGSPGNPIAVR